MKKSTKNKLLIGLGLGVLAAGAYALGKRDGKREGIIEAREEDMEQFKSGLRNLTNRQKKIVGNNEAGVIAQLNTQQGRPFEILKLIPYKNIEEGISKLENDWAKQNIDPRKVNILTY